MKENWALVYGRDMFCAYKTTTQQSQRLIDTHHEEESKTNFKALQSSISLSFPIKILKHAATLYTPTLFEMVETEVRKGYDCEFRIQSGGTDTITKYKVIVCKEVYQHTIAKYSLSFWSTITCFFR